MDYTLEKKSVPVREAVFDGCFEQPLDLDFTLPDYCPSIEKILKCRVIPQIHSKSLSGDRLTIEGAAAVCVLYIDEEKKSLRSCEHSIPYSGSVNVKSDCTDAVIMAYSKTEYVNCRAISPRRLDIHGAFSICAKIDSIKSKETAVSCDSEDIQLKKESISCSRLCALSQQQFSIAEELTPVSGSPAVRSIIKTDMKVRQTECRIAGDKAMIKGELCVRALYIADNEIGECVVTEFVIPVGQVIDAAGIENDSKTDCRLQLLSGECKLREGESGSIICVECRLCAFVAAYCPDKIEYISDAFSTKYEIDSEYSSLKSDKLIDICRENSIIKSSADTETNGISKVIDIWGEGCTATPAFENGTAIIKGKLNACILALDNDSVPFYAERSIDYLCPIKLNIEEVEHTTVDCEASVDSISFRLSGGSNIDLRCEITVEARAFENSSVRTLTKACADEEHRRSCDNAALTLYFADKGESVWKIARSYSAVPEAIMNENDLSDDELDDECMLLIPGIN